MSHFLRTLALVAACGAAFGCQTRNAAQGSDRTVIASYRGRELTADLPPHIRVPSIAAAAEATLRHRGYGITTKASTEDYARVEGEGPRAGVLERVIVRARQTPGKTRVQIVAEPLGDQTLSRSVLDEILASLGL